MKAPLHHVAVDEVVERDEAHALVVRHEGANDGALLRLRQALRRVVDGLVVAVARERALAREAAQVRQRPARRDHRRQRRRVRRDHEVFREPALEPQAGHAEGAVLVVEVEVAAVVGGLRDAPRDAALLAVFDLPPDHRPVRLVEQRPAVAAHDEERHQVLEHRPRPGDERAAPVHGRELAAEVEPVLLRRVALGDGDEAREARFRRQEVVVRVVGLPRGDVVADAEDLALLVEEEAEVHPLEKLAAAPRQPAQARQQRRRGGRRVFDGRGERGRAAEQRPLVRVGRPRAQFRERGVVDFRRARQSLHPVECVREFGSQQRGGQGGGEDVCEVRVARAHHGREGAQVARELLHLTQQRPRPEARLGEIARPVLLRERDEHVVRGRGVPVQRVEERLPIAQREGRRARDRVGAGRELGPQVIDGDDLRALPRRAHALHLKPQQRDGVAEPRERVRAEERALGQIDARLLEREQVAGEVPAVDGRDVLGFQRLQRARVVPVEEVAAELRHLTDGVEGQLQALDQFERARVTEVVRGGGRNQEQPDVGGRGAMGHHGLRVFLKIIGRQPLVFLRDERLEEAPRAPRDEPRLLLVGRREFLAPDLAAPADPVGDERRGGPRQQKRRGDRQRLGAQRDDERADLDQERPDGPHEAQGRGERRRAARLRLRGRRPFEQSAFRDELAVERAPDGVAHQVRLVREERERQRDLRGVRPRVPPHAPEVARPGDAARVEQQARRHVRVDGERQREQHEERPPQGRARQQRPREDEPDDDARRDEAAPQIVENLPAPDEREPVPHAAPVRVGHGRQHPARDLPVAARPAVLPHRVRHVARRVVV